MNNKFTEKLYRFMYGRYGIDELYMFLTIVSTILVTVCLIIGICSIEMVVKVIIMSIITAMWIGVLFLAFYRMMSKKIVQRRHENEMFLKTYSAVVRFITFNTSFKSKSSNLNTNEYVFRDCNKCSATLRLPRKPGRHKVKCPCCKHSFYVQVGNYKAPKKKK